MELESAQTNEINLAIFQAKQEFEPLLKKDWNPHLKSYYAGFPATLEAIEKAFIKHKLILSFPTAIVAERPCVICTITHVPSSQFIRAIFPIVEQKLTAQELGSSTTYAKRYSLQALLGLATEDDDGHGSSKANQSRLNLPAQKSDSIPAMIITKKEIKEIEKAVGQTIPLTPKVNSFVKKQFGPKPATPPVSA